MNRFHLEIQYVPESVTLLNVVAQPAPFMTNYMNRMAARYGMTPDERAHKVVDLLQEIEDAARAEFAKDMETLKFYCDSEIDNGKIDSFANIIVLSGGVCDHHHRTVEEQAEYLEQLPEQDYITSFYEIVKAYGASTTDDSSTGKETITDVFDMIVQMNESDARKLQLQQLFLHHKEHEKTVLGLMLRAQKILKKYEKKLRTFGEEVIAYIEGELQGQSLVDFIVQNYYNDFKLPIAEKGSDIYISYMKANTMGFFIHGETLETSGIVCILGVIFSEGMNLRMLMSQRASITEEKALAMLKLLADKSKFQILSATIDTPAYGSELANMLGLTTATISHHTTALLDQNLLSLDKVDTKIYYRTNPEMIRALIRYLQENLLHE
ncbi:MAG: ArsR family transcriptional regulator [Lachnospiraceae bacterium]|nr:ArsR family transcriptional regulator [Lachnospiraceae bacterium]